MTFSTIKNHFFVAFLESIYIIYRKRKENFMKKFKLAALALLASAFGLASCDLPEFIQVPVDWANEKIVDPIKDLIPGGKDKEEQEDEGEDEGEKEKAEVVSVKVSGLPEDIDDETAPFQLSAEVEVKGDASKDVTWSSSDTSVATVDANGKVTLTGAEGKVTISAASVADPSKVGSVEFEVFINPAVLSVKIEGAPESEVLLYSGDVELSANVATKGQIATAVSWSSSDESIATVDANGVVSLLSVGEVTITATSTSDSSKKDSVTIKIVNKGLHPELLEEGYEFSEEWPRELLNAYVGVEAPEALSAYGFYYRENLPSVDSNGDSVAGNFEIVADFDTSIMNSFMQSAGALGYYPFLDSTYSAYYFYTFCFMDPTSSAEIDFDYYLLSEEGDTFSFYAYHTEDIWGSKEKTSDEDWSSEAKEEMAKFGAEIPFIALGADYEVEYDEDYNELAVYDNCPVFNLLDSYKDILLEAGFSEIGDEENGYSYKKDLGLSTLVVEYQFTIYGNTIIAHYEYSFAKVLEGVVEMYANEGIENVVLPDYPNAEISLEEIAGYSYAYVIKGSTAEEMQAYAAALEEAGWTLEADKYGDYYGSYGDTLAGLYLADYIEYSYGGIVIQFYVNEPLVTSVSFEEEIAAFAEAGYEVEIPDYEGEGFSVEYNENYGYYLFHGSDAEEMQAYAAALAEAGWVLETDEYGDYSGTFGDSLASVYLGDYTAEEDYEGILLQFFVDVPAVESVNFDDVVSAYAQAGIELSIPDFEGEELKLDVENGTFYVVGATIEELQAFEKALEEAGWTLEYPYLDDYGWYDAKGHYGENELCTIEIGDYVSYGYVSINFGVPAVPTSSLSFEDVVSAYAQEGIELSIPDFEGESFTVEYDDGIYWITGATSEELETFENALAEAGWSVTLSDPENCLDASGSLLENDRAYFTIGDFIESDGYFGVYFGLNPAPVAGFPSEEANAFLSEYGFGFSIDNDAASAIEALLEEGEAFGIVLDEDEDGYHFCRVQMDGLHGEEVSAIINPIIETAGYVYDEDLGCYYNDDFHIVNYQEYEGVTYILFFE